MSTVIKKRHNSYRALEGVVLGWERGTVGQGHKVQIIEGDNAITTFKWRAPKDPIAGDQVTVVLPETGVSAKPDRAVMILNHTTGETHREVNAHDPRGARRIMVQMVIWLTIAAIIASILFNVADTEMGKIIILAAAALMVWRIAIATFKLREDEKTAQRKLDEESVCTDLVMNEWEKHTDRKPRMAIDYDANGTPTMPTVIEEATKQE